MDSVAQSASVYTVTVACPSQFPSKMGVVLFADGESGLESVKTGGLGTIRSLTNMKRSSVHGPTLPATSVALALMA